MSNNTNTLKIDDQEYMRVKEFKFLGTILAEDNDITTEIKQRIIMANNVNCAVLFLTVLFCC